MCRGRVVVAVAINVGEARLEILEYGVTSKTDDVGLTVARFDYQGAGSNSVAKNAVVVTAGGLGELGRGDIMPARGHAAVGQRVLGQFRLGRIVDKAKENGIAVALDGVPKPADLDTHHAARLFQRR